MLFWIILIAILILLLICLVLAWLVLTNVFGCRKNECQPGSVPRRYRRWAKAYEEGWRYLKKLKIEEYELTSRDGLKLKGYYIPAIGEAERTIIFAHGYRDTPFEDIVPMLRFYREESCGIFLITHRGHDKSEGRWVTFSIKESQDLMDWIRFAADLPSVKGRPIYPVGVSMGAASVMRLLGEKEKLPEEVVGLIEDSGFTDPGKELVYTAREHFHMPAFPIAYIVTFYVRLILHVDLNLRSAREYMKENETLPVLFIHGTGDHVVPVSQSVRAYLACRAGKLLCLIDNAPHICGYFTDPEKYQAAVEGFFAGVEGWEETEEVFDEEDSASGKG